MGEERDMDMKKKWEDHADFLADMAGRICCIMDSTGSDRIDTIGDYTRWLSLAVFKHAEKHCVDKLGARGGVVMGKEGERVKEMDSRVSEDVKENARAWNENEMVMKW